MQEHVGEGSLVGLEPWDFFVDGAGSDRVASEICVVIKPVAGVDIDGVASPDNGAS